MIATSLLDLLNRCVQLGFFARTDNSSASPDKSYSAFKIARIKKRVFQPIASRAEFNALLPSCYTQCFMSASSELGQDITLRSFLKHRNSTGILPLFQ